MSVICRPVEGEAEKANVTMYFCLDFGLPTFMANFALRNMIVRITGRLGYAYNKCRDDPLVTTFHTG